jgi:hypothetical protein
MEIPLRLKYRVGGKSRHGSRSSNSGANRKKVRGTRHPNQVQKYMLMEAGTGHRRMVTADQLAVILGEI